ncbi:MAG TPA: type VI secretion system baseplate subunit TssF, partial [Cytophagales bacterium]|nr:type VI secretion system baseplate subunit TssF [Cytophagales bacterium]
MEQTLYINEELKGRMLRHVSAIWGIRNTDALDPLVRLLVEAIAGELQKTHHEIENFEKRILEKIAILLTPGILSAPYPAHAVVHAQPVETTHHIDTKTHFFLSKKITNEKEPPHDLFFTPVVDTKLFKGQIKYMVSGNKAFVMDNPLQKTIFLTGQARSEHSNAIWLGLQLDHNIKAIDNLSFYIDFKNISYKKQLFSLFHSSNWFIGEHKLKVGKGNMYNLALNKAALFADFDTMHLLEREVAHLYDEHFITIEDPYKLQANDASKYPTEFASIFTNSDLAKFTDPLLWVKVVTPSLVEERMLIDMFVSINAFPVLNRKLNKLQYRLKSITNIIPIKSEQYEYFVSVDNLKDSSNKEYKQIPYAHHDNELTDTYSVRKSGTERIDSRSSKEYLRYMIELVRDESVAFSSYGQDTITALIKELDKILAQMEQRVKQSKSVHTDAHYYVTVESITKNETYFLDYWTTNSIHANSIHA